VWFDYDNDGRLDLFVSSFVLYDKAAQNLYCTDESKRRYYCVPRFFKPRPSYLFRNNGDGTFKDVSKESGIADSPGKSFGAVATDVNNDGLTDLFVANDTAANHVWINQRNGTFKEVGVASGAAYSEDGLAKAGMGVAIGDADGDGREDIFVVNLMREGATLFRNDRVLAGGIPSFVDVTRASRLYTITFPFTGFGTGWFDYDADGRLDLFVANGAVTLREEQRGQPAPYREKNLLIHNEGEKFADVTGSAGSVLQLLEVSRGAAFGDFNNDGRVDVLITNNSGPARLLINHSAPAPWVEVLLEGKGAMSRDAFGALITVKRDGLPGLVRRVHTDSSYCSASDRRVHFGLGTHANIRAIKVEWPDGSVEQWDSPGANRVLHLIHGTGSTTQ
jgi:hypothetical protein